MIIVLNSYMGLLYSRIKLDQQVYIKYYCNVINV